MPAHDVRPPLLVKVPAEILPRMRHPQAYVPRRHVLEVIELDVDVAGRLEEDDDELHHLY
jgi:hypothetical protein